LDWVGCIRHSGDISLWSPCSPIILLVPNLLPPPMCRQSSSLRLQSFRAQDQHSTTAKNSDTIMDDTAIVEDNPKPESCGQPSPIHKQQRETAVPPGAKRRHCNPATLGTSHNSRTTRGHGIPQSKALTAQFMKYLFAPIHVSTPLGLLHVMTLHSVRLDCGKRQHEIYQVEHVSSWHTGH